MKPTAAAQVYIPVVIAAAMVVLMIVGIVRNYSPVPFWDMWDGYVGFYLRLLNGDTAAWWDFHNEHRIVLTRALFFADLAWAGGRGIIPLVSNVVFAAIGATGLCFALRRSTPHWTARQRLPWYALIVASLAFWSQAQNFTWAFQPQFFLAFMLPLAAFLFAAESATRPGAHMPFAAACLLAVLSLGSMANGVLTLPLLAVLYAALGLSRLRWAFVALLAAIGLATARLGYPMQSSAYPFHLTWENCLAVVRYLVLYMGSPLGNVLPLTRWTLIASAVAGTMLLAITLVALVRGWRVRRIEPVRLALAAFSLYVCVSAAATALGRFDLGPVSALSGRYTTPVLMAFAANITVFLPRTWAPRWSWQPTAVLLAMIPAQAMALQPAHDLVEGRFLAALAIELQIDDAPILHRVFPRDGDVLSIGRAARDARLSVFAEHPLKGSHELIGRRVTGLSCEGHVTSSEKLPDGAHFRILVRLDSQGGPRTSRIVLIDERDRIAGIAVYARWAPNADGATSYATGYVSAAPSVDPATLRVCLLPSSS